MQAASQPTATYSCHLCPKSFLTSKGLNIHKTKAHRTCVSQDDVPLNLGGALPPHHTHPFHIQLSQLKNNVEVVKRIPRGARIVVATHLAQLVQKCYESNSPQDWHNLLVFPYTILHVKDDDQNISLTQKIKNNCSPHSVPPVVREDRPSTLYRKNKNIENKISDGDLKGAARLLFSSDVLSPDNPDTLLALQAKHPAAPATPFFFDPPVPPELCLHIKDVDVYNAVLSFKTGSAAGLDGLAPQHLKDLTCPSVGDAGVQLIACITKLINFMYSGGVHPDIVPIIYGANLIALTKKDGGVRPIAVGSTFRRLASKIAVRYILAKLQKIFEPVQLGFGVRGGCEAAVHALRSYLEAGQCEVLLKIDVKNAFNSLNRDILLSEVKSHIPEIYNYLLHCYGDPSKLMYHSHELSSEVGCQQGDPLGPAIFSLGINQIIKNLSSKFNVWYLDDGTLGGDVDSVLVDLSLINDKFRSIGLTLNFDKCELYIPDSCVVDVNSLVQRFNQLAPNIKILDRRTLCLLGSPIFEESFPDYIQNSVSKFQDNSHRLLEISPHYALSIIKFCLFIPKLTYVLRCCPLWKNQDLLSRVDDLIKNNLERVLNIKFSDRSWCQGSLPIRHGGLGIRTMSGVALPAFLSSVHSSLGLIGKILRTNYEISGLEDAKNAWLCACPGQDIPEHPESQRNWDDPVCKLALDTLLDQCGGAAERARLLAVGTREAGHWLRAHPSPKIGTFLEPNTLRLSICLRLGIPVCAPHRCPCGADVDQLGHHGLSCQRSAGRFSRHAALNDIIRRSLASVNVPALLEPTGILRSDGKRPDGMSLIPWSMGRVLVWDATCVDTLAPSHLHGTSVRAAAAAEAAENAKVGKYRGLGAEYRFIPFGVETLGPWGPGALSLFGDLSKRLRDATGDPRAGSYLAQRFSLAVQRGNAASILGTLPQGPFLDLG
ncbi:uncharacterized protein LOC134654659 [Cydia amplana]|uniref:uncharacterized protein LOC134654659 n=1 Tax=Cydia amplana TaxID=1869771 RepID=UPI002FE54E5F